MSEVKRVHPPSKATKKAEDYHGSAKYERVSPDISTQERIAEPIKSLNFHVTFEEAMKLSLALQSCLMHLNRFHRGQVEGKMMGVELTVHTGTSRIKVIEKSIRPRNKK
jgi:hypothetical protein